MTDLRPDRGYGLTPTELGAANAMNKMQAEIDTLRAALAGIADMHIKMMRLAALEALTT